MAQSVKLEINHMSIPLIQIFSYLKHWEPVKNWLKSKLFSLKKKIVMIFFITKFFLPYKCLTSYFDISCQKRLFWRVYVYNVLFFHLKTYMIILC
jgi:hypothetical protein